ncbi:MAG: hypothetical protein LBQ92_00230, partial [Propionibacteriaceae bacterium]|nr:hypothetical protein [Propionibacteriaceae bacterium]
MSESTATAPFDPPGLDWRPAQKGLLALRLIGNGVASAVIAAAGIGVWVLFPETWILVVTGVLF